MEAQGLSEESIKVMVVMVRSATVMLVLVVVLLETTLNYLMIWQILNYLHVVFLMLMRFLVFAMIEGSATVMLVLVVVLLVMTLIYLLVFLIMVMVFYMQP